MQIIKIGVWIALVSASWASPTCTCDDDCPNDMKCLEGYGSYATAYCAERASCQGSSKGSCPLDGEGKSMVCAMKDDTYSCMPASGCEGDCAASCTSEGSNEMCNARGTCSSSDTDASSFKCECDSGWTGDKCETSIDNGAAASSCTEGSDSCGENGTCVGNACLCTEGWTGDQCETAPGASTTSKNPTGADNIDALQEGDDSNSYTLFFVIGAVGAVAVAALAAIGIKSRRELHEDEEGVVDKDMFESPNVNGGPTLSSAFNEDLESRGTLTSIGTGGGGNLTPKDSITIF